MPVLRIPVEKRIEDNLNIINDYEKKILDKEQVIQNIEELIIYNNEQIKHLEDAGAEEFARKNIYLNTQIHSIKNMIEKFNFFIAKRRADIEHLKDKIRNPESKNSYQFSKFHLNPTPSAHLDAGMERPDYDGVSQRSFNPNTNIGIYHTSPNDNASLGGKRKTRRRKRKSRKSRKGKGKGK